MGKKNKKVAPSRINNGNSDWKAALNSIKEFLLPPCEYQILSDEILDYTTGLNNNTGQTRYIEMVVNSFGFIN